MASYYEKTVTVTVSMDTSASDAVTYSNVLALCAHNLNSSTYQEYTSSDAVLEAGFATNSPTYMLINNMYSAGSYPPEYVNVARVTPDTYTIQVSEAYDEGTDVGLYVNMDGTEATVSYTVLSTDTTATLIATGLAAALTTAYDNSSDDSYPVFAASGDTITVTIASDTYPCSFGWYTSDDDSVPHCVIGSTTSDSLTSVIVAALQEDSDVTFLVSEYHDSDNVKTLAAYCEGTLLQYFTSTADDDVKDADNTSNLATALADLEYDQTSMQYSATADTYFPEGGLLGWLAGLNPYDLYNPSFWTLSGCLTDSLSSTERSTLADRNVNFYITNRSEGKYYSGWASSGEFIDTVRFAKIWSKETIYEAIDDLFYRKSSLGKAVPYDDKGAGMMRNAIMTNYVNVGVAGGRIADGTTTNSTTGDVIDLSAQVDFGTRADQTTSNISNRIWDNATIDVVFISGINHVNLSLYVELNRDSDS